MSEVKADQFVIKFGRRVLTDNGEPGMDGEEGIGSTTERHQGAVAAAIYANCDYLDLQQLDEIIEWVELYRSELITRMGTSHLQLSVSDHDHDFDSLDPYRPVERVRYDDDEY